ncbi:uncharacterized protein [Palaemon carinicauda]|uniref:uncharacterized protein n=1 Tax=Palaemon carinicauda TaxID=392227 RepID=UPI0035B67CD9
MKAEHLLSEHDIIQTQIQTSNIFTWFYTGKLVILVFDFIHGLSHHSCRSTSQLLKTKFIWHGISKDAMDLVQACTSCQTSKVHRHTDSGMGTFPQPRRRFTHIHVNVITAYNPAANGMVGRFHRNPKADLMYHCKDSNCFTQPPWVLLRLRAPPKNTLDVSADEMVYGDPMVVTAEFFLL